MNSLEYKGYRGTIEKENGIDDYLENCRINGEEPEKENDNQLNPNGTIFFPWSQPNTGG